MLGKGFRLKPGEDFDEENQGDFEDKEDSWSRLLSDLRGCDKAVSVVTVDRSYGTYHPLFSLHGL